MPTADRILRVRRSATAAAVVGVVVAGLVLRAWVLSSALGPFDSDEAVGGLVARHFLHGEGAAFLWGNNYGGTLEALFTAPLFALFGSGLITLKIVPIAAFAVACWLTWRIGLRTVGPDAARLGAALLWVSSGAVIVLSTKARLYYGSSLVLACAVVLLCLRLAERPSRRDVAVLGLVVGLGVWTAPFVFYVAIPILVWLVATRPRVVFQAPWAVPGALAGASPWLVYNLRTGWDALAEHYHPLPVATSYASRLTGFYKVLVPELLGLKNYFGSWTPGRISEVVFLGLLAAGAALALWCLAHPRGAVVPLVVIAAAYPFLYAVPRASWYLGEPRYGLFLAPVLALLLARGVTVVLRRPAAHVAVVAAAVLLSVVSIHALLVTGERHPGHYDVTPPRLARLARALDAQGVRTVVADYWISYALSFESRERIIATPTSNARYRPYWEQVVAGGPGAWVFFHDQADNLRFEAAVRTGGVAARRVPVDQFDVWLVERPLPPPPPPE